MRFLVVSSLERGDRVVRRRSSRVVRLQAAPVAHFDSFGDLGMEGWLSTSIARFARSSP